MEPATESVKFGQYELLQEIGHGGMAVVHRAVLRGLGGFQRQVVIKRILPELASDQHFVKMFVEEARLSALLDHPNIVQIQDFGVIDNTYFLAMEYIEGIPLHHFMRKYARKSAPPEAIAYIVQQVCIGLQYAHGLTREGQLLGLVHRDVSPANIMISTHGAVKLLDFGIAKAVEAIDREETRTGTLKGKWSYMAPEQVVGQPVTPRSDIFSVGIVLWELVTGRRLFKAKTDYLTLSNVVQARVPPVTEFRPDAPKIFDTICARALARRPKDRYRSAEEMADQLDGYLAASPCTAARLASLVTPMLQEQAPAGTDEESGHTAPSASSSESAVGFRIETHESVSMSGLVGQQEPIALRRNWTVPVLSLAVLLAAVGVMIIYFAIPAAGPVATGQPPVELRVVSVPAGASVELVGEGTPRGRTPLQLALQRQPTRLRVTLAGYTPQEREIVPEAQRELSFALQPVAKPPPKPEPVVKPQPKPKPEPVVKPQPKPEPVAKPQPQPKPEPVVKPQPKPEPVAKLPKEPKAKPKPARPEPVAKVAKVPKPKSEPKGKHEPTTKKAQKKSKKLDLKGGDLVDDPYGR